MLVLYGLAVICAVVSVLMHLLGTYGISDHPPFYHRIWWWDLAAHAIVSVPIAVTAITLASFHTHDPLVIIAATVFITACIGILWEVYEYVVWDEHEAGPRLYPEDTALDLLTEYAVALTTTVIHIHA